MKNSFLFILLFTLIIVGCKKDDSDHNQNNTNPINLNGKIILPIGSSIDDSSLKVLSSTDQSFVSDGDFNLIINNNYSSLYVTNTSDEVMMIGYKYPGSPSDDITSSTTALGLVMMSPTAIYLSDAGKQNLLNNVLSDNNFQTLVNEIEQNLIQNKALFDTTATSLMAPLTALYESASTKASLSNQDLPVNMFNSGRNFTFNNSGNAYSTVIGVYKNNSRVKKIVVDGVQIVPNSISDLLAGNGNSIGNPVDSNYTLSGDGDFTFKFRTGKPGFGDGSAEHDEAFYENLGQFSYNLLLTLIPNLNITTCRTSIVNNVINTVQSVSGLVNNPNLRTVLYTVADITFSNINNLINNCVNVVSLEQKWLYKFLDHWNFINKAFGVISNGANTTFFGTQWALSEAVVDTCFSAQGASVTECGGCGGQTTFTDLRDGQTYNIVTIDNQCWFAENLNYVTSNSWCYDNNTVNCDNYGRLYRWDDAQTACPNGWHLPTDAEWSILTDYLGGESVAGGKMKSSTGWNTPNTNATNSSGFFGLPGGAHRDGGFNPDFFDYLSYYGYWWSSTPSNANNAWSRSLSYNSVQVSRIEAGASVGISNRGQSCRCLKD